MLFKKSPLNNSLNMYNFLFEEWDRESFSDSSIEEIVFKKNKIKLTFQEDLREHIVNLFVTDSLEINGKVYYREIKFLDNLIGVEEMKKSISLLGNKNNVEKQEIEIYVNFLKANKILC